MIPSATAVHGSTGTQKPGSDIDATVCPDCKGSGSIMEEYNHRRMEKFCTTCDGRGVRMYRNGTEIVEGAPQPGTTAERAAYASKADAAVRQLENDIAMIDQKLESYEQEKAALGVKRPKSDEEGARLLKALLDQIDSQIMKLKRVRHSRREELEKRRPATQPT